LRKIKPPARAAEAMLARLKRYTRTDATRLRGYIRGGVTRPRVLQLYHPADVGLEGLFIRFCGEHGLDFQEEMLASLGDPSDVAFWPIAIAYLGESVSTKAIPLLRRILESHETRSQLMENAKLAALKAFVVIATSGRWGVPPRCDSYLASLAEARTIAGPLFGDVLLDESPKVRAAAACFLIWIEQPPDLETCRQILRELPVKDCSRAHIERHLEKTTEAHL